MSSVCDRLFCLTLGHEYSPEFISLEGGGRDELRLPIIGVVARSPRGWVLLETGCDPRPFDGAREHDIYRGRLPEFPPGDDPLLDALAAVGLDVSDLTLAAVSHLHIDHAGGLRHLARAGVPVAVQERELTYARERAGRAQAYVREDYEHDDLDWIVLDGDAEIAPGIDAVFTPGHTPGHMSYRVRMARSGTWLLAIDAIDLARGIEENRPIGWSADEADAPKRRASHDRLVGLARREGARLVPGHCPVTWPRLAHVEGFH
jgi:glyoxylase-like metal-dependent hydrolase (beta-lactamase superfamily II)